MGTCRYCDTELADSQHTCSECMEARYHEIKTGEPMRSRKKFLNPGPYLKWAYADHPATLAIIGVNTLVLFLFLMSMGRTDFDKHLIAWGGGLGTLQLDGQWWRLVTSFFLHAGLLHLWFNMNCLDDFGGAVERNFGRRIFLVGYFASGLGSSLISMSAHPEVLSVGASGAIFGTVGMIVPAVIAKRVVIDRDDQKVAAGGLLAFIILNLGFGALAPGIDNAAHVGGLIVGLLIGLMLLTKAPVESPAGLD